MHFIYSREVLKVLLNKYKKNKLNKMKKGNKSLLIAVITVIVAVFMLCSCGSRKVNKSKTQTKEVTKIESTKVDSSKTLTNLDSNTKIVDNSVTDEFTISPVDNNKEIIVNGKTYFNVVLKSKKVNNNKVIDNKKNVSVISQNNVKTDVKVNKSKIELIAVKKIDKKQFNFLSLWWILLIIPIYLLWKRFR